MSVEAPEAPVTETPPEKRVPQFLKEPAIREIPTPEIKAPEGAVSTAPAVAAKVEIPKVKRPVGRPPGSGTKNKSTTPKPAPPPKPEPPNFDEWQTFISTVVLRWVCRAFVAVAFRGLPEYRELLTDNELDDLELDDEQLESVSRPFANIVTGSKFSSRYGRGILNSKDAIEAGVVLFMYAQRVNRVARKYKPKHAKNEVQGTVTQLRSVSDGNVSSGQDVQGSPAPTVGNVIAGRPPGVGFN